MVFVIKTVLLTALVYSASAGLLSSGDSHDSYVSSALSAPSASYGGPAPVYGPPVVSEPLAELNHLPSGPAEGHLLQEEHGGAIESAPVAESPAFLSGAEFSSGHIRGPAPVIDNEGIEEAAVESGDYDGAAIGSGHGAAIGGLYETGHGAAGLSGSGIGLESGAPRVIGSYVSVGHPVAEATRYELQSVVQNIVRRVPIEVIRHVKVAVPHPVPVPVPQEVKVPVPQPYPVHVDVVKHVPYPVFKTQHVEVERPVPVEVVKHVTFPVIKKVHVPVERPVEVIKKVHVPIEKHVEVPVPVWKPYPIHIIKHITHYKKKGCCW